MVAARTVKGKTGLEKSSRTRACKTHWRPDAGMTTVRLCRSVGIGSEPRPPWWEGGEHQSRGAAGLTNQKEPTQVFDKLGDAAGPESQTLRRQAQAGVD